ncbi:MAG: antitoxin [Candidatus Riflebacteria bacterium]|nr:antitoxin [Candidatus Riflebacteria bacterium]
MARTTIDIDDPILRDLKRLRAKRKTTLGRLVSDLLAEVLHSALDRKPARPEFTWQTKTMGARVDLRDKEALWHAMESRRRDDEPA